ncbi:hypothetical protein SCHPADRAFT_945467 [Schizopora paradoxa]|uniref:BTB domain-containing protein n=1 Tax=Schizopora paradoxa TaxID=27342 RepID=A0A0H2RCI8_9AGAM|nr:hypothetical protein SCHPADRAFT_945467 [Schizopora paradoxa]
MPPKRRRTSESTPSNDDGNPTGPRPHDKLWFSDGTIVLATDVHLYRVHKGMLAKYSTVLNDMFEMPTGESNSECWEDVPIVEMVGDKDEEVSILLKALYERNFRDTLRGCKTTELCSLLLISTKYDFLEVQGDVVQFLESLFPSKFEDFVPSSVDWGSMNASDLFELLAVAHRCETLSFLPLIYYFCAALLVKEAPEGLRIVPNECMISLMQGRDWLCWLSQYFIRLSLPSPMADGQYVCAWRPSSCLEHFRAKLNERYPAGQHRFVFFLSIPPHGILGLQQNGICGNCASRYILKVDEFKKAAWKKLPEVFLGKKWEELVRK